MPNHHVATNEPNGNDQHTQKKQKIFEFIWNKLFKGKANAWMAMFAAILTIFTYVQVRLARIAAENNIATQRAFINPLRRVSGTRIVQDGKVVGMRFEIRLENSGMTPAQSMTGGVNLQPFSPDMPQNFKFKDLQRSEPYTYSTILGPRSSFGAHPIATLDHLVGVVEHRHRLYMWGWVTYRDVFPETPVRLTEFCYEISDVATNGPVTDPKTDFTWTLTSCHIPYDCYDEDCADYEERVAQNRQPVTP